MNRPTRKQRKWPTYPAYKPSGIEWLGEVPEHWEVKRLKYFTKLNPSVSEIMGLQDEDEASFVPMGNVSAYGGLRLDTNKTIEELRNGFTYFRDGDIVIAKITPCFENGKGSIAEELTNGIAFGTTELHVIRPYANIDREFLFYLTISDAFRSIGAAEMYGAGGQKRVPTDFVRDFPASCPCVEEQHTIATFLDERTAKIDALIEAKRELLARLKEKRQALITHAVTKGLDPNTKMKPSGIDWLGEVPEHWIVKSLKWDSPVQRGASPRPIDDPVYFDDDGEYAWVRIADVTAAGTYLEETTQRLSALGASLSVKMQPGELFLSIAGSVGKPCITKIKCCIHDGFVYFPHLSCNRKYLYYIFASGEPYKGLGKLGTQLNLNTDTVGSIHIGFPPGDEQQAIVGYLDEQTIMLDSIADEARSAIDRLTEYRTALISAAVTGKIDVRGGVA